VDPYLETKSSAQAVQETLNDFSKRQVDVTSSLENWTTSIAEKREVEYLLEKVMSDNEEVSAGIGISEFNCVWSGSYRVKYIYI